MSLRAACFLREWISAARQDNRLRFAPWERGEGMGLGCQNDAWMQGIPPEELEAVVATWMPSS